jgi:penicillin-binding protein 2
LTLDLELQRIAETALRQGMAKVSEKLGHAVKSGVVVVLNPQTGELLASVSLPTYDNNLFARGIGQDDLTRLYEDPYTPLINHAVGGQYPPGSTFKIVTAATGLEEGVVSQYTTLFDPGRIVLYNQPFVCWKASGHGNVNVVRALAVSCDVFFYEVGGGYPPNGFAGLGIDRLANYAQAFGFGAPTGTGLPGEASGLIPTEKWKRLTYSELWTLGDSYNAAIGQGFVVVTPLQLANAFAALANGGTLYQVQLVREVRQGEELVQGFEPHVLGQIPVSPENLALVRQGLREAVTSPGGTAWLANLPDVEVAAKTGTAEFCDNIAVKEGFCKNGQTLPTHAWFAAFAPYEQPEIAVVVFLYNGGQGSESAGPIAAEVLKAYFSRQQ